MVVIMICIKSITNISAVILFSFFLLFGPFVQESLAEFYMCRNDDCATYVIEDNQGYSWHIECMDGTTASGRTNGAAYGGSCKQMVIK